MAVSNRASAASGRPTAASISPRPISAATYSGSSSEAEAAYRRAPALDPAYVAALIGRVEPRQRRLGPADGRLDLPQADQRGHVLGVELQGAAIGGLRLGQPPLGLEDQAEPLMGLGQVRCLR